MQALKIKIKVITIINMTTLLILEKLKTSIFANLILVRFLSDTWQLKIN